MEEQEGLCTLSSVLLYAISEWLLMLLLFVDGLFSYMVTKFAKHCKLQTPCLFCSRLDHILGSRERGFYKHLICSSHKLEVSTLAYCHIHQKLSDVCDMCEPCLLSFATEKKTNTETYRSLVGKLAVNLENDRRVHPEAPETGAEVPSQNDLDLGFIQKRCCSCCKDHLGVKSPIHGLLQIGSIGSEIVEARNELLSLTGPDHHSEPPDQDKKSELCWKPRTVSHGENQNSDDPLSHFGYTELKITSDSESEAAASDDDNGHTVIHGHNDAKKDFASQSTQTELDTSDANFFLNSTSGKLPLQKEVHTPPVVSVATVAVPGKQLPSTEPSDVVSSALSSSVGNEMKELNKNEIRADEPSSCFDMVPDEASPEVLDSKNPKIVNTPAVSSNAINEEPDQAETISKQGLTNNDSPATTSGILGLNDTYKLVISNKGNEASPRDPSRAQEDLRLLVSQMSSARGLDFPWNEMTPSPSPRVHSIGEETKPLDGSSSSGLQSFTRRFSLERNESGLSSLDGSAFSEIEGENDIDRLKRLVEFEKKQLFLLYKELEEERNASAIAANQAMAMITRLQEEKAAMQMEALHYQRMVEEQAEYDHEALQKSSDLLAEREKELEDLKFEISTYRNQLMDMYNGNKAMGLVDDADKKETTPTSRHHGKQSVGVHRSSQSGRVLLNLNLEKEGEDAQEDFLLNFEDERMYISKCLEKLENRLHLFSNNRSYTEEQDIPECVLKNGQNGEKTLGNSEIQSCHLDMAQENIQVGEDSGYVQNDTGLSRLCTDLTLPFHIENCEDHPSSSSTSNLKEPNKHFRAIDRENIILAFEAEIFQLSERLKALEDDCNFIEQAINSLKNGSEGIQFVQEIACQLQELRKLRMRKHSQLLDDQSTS